jgi:osmoprotectant transport system permease protein
MAADTLGSAEGGGVNYVEQAIKWLNDPLNWTNPGGILDALRQHLLLSAGAVAIACVVALPIGIWFGHIGRGGASVVALSNMTRAIPTYALLAIFVVASEQLGAPSVIPALAIFAVPPLLANAYVGVREVDPEVREAAKGMGMSGWQLLCKVELPLAVPYILAGFRNATVQVIATATLAALVAGGGLGTIITAGFGLTISAGGGQILAGAFLVAVLALVVNAVISLAAHWLTPPPLRSEWRTLRRRRSRAADM